MKNNNFAIILAVIVGIVAIVGLAAFFIFSQKSQVLMGTGPLVVNAVDCAIKCDKERIRRELIIRTAFNHCMYDANYAGDMCSDTSCLTQFSDCQRNENESDSDYYFRCRDSCTSSSCINCLNQAANGQAPNQNICDSEQAAAESICGQTRDSARVASDEAYRVCRNRCQGIIV